jgi:outer membrane protein assembly factor BamB
MEKTVGALICLILVFSLVLIPFANADWNMFRADPSHDGVGTGNPVLTPAMLWDYQTNGSVWAAPAIVGGIVYVGSQDGNVYALSATSGVKIWNYNTGNPVGSSPAVVDGVVYITADSPSNVPPSGIPPPQYGYIYALSANNGDKIWNYTTQGWVTSPIVEDGVVYFGSEAGEVYALEAANGSELWKSTTEIKGSAITSTPAVVGGVVYYGSFDGGVYALNATTGDQMWRSFTSGGESSPAVVNGVIYIGSTLHNVYALNAASGTILWNYTTGEDVWSSPAVAEGIVYIGSDDGNVYALNAANGNQLWNFSTGSGTESSPAEDGGVVYISSDNSVYALNAGTGAKLWSFTAGAGTYADSDPVVDGDEVFVGCGNYVYAFGNSIVQSSHSETILLVTTPTGTSVDLELNGNITNAQMSLIHITTNKFNTSETLSFKLAGESGTGFSNITIPKSGVLQDKDGTSVTVLIDNKTAPEQGYTQDANNYYVWYTTHFGTQETALAGYGFGFSIVSIVFTKASSQSLPIEAIYGIVATVTLVTIVAVVLMLIIKGKKGKSSLENRLQDLNAFNSQRLNG